MYFNTYRSALLSKNPNQRPSDEKWSSPASSNDENQRKSLSGGGLCGVLERSSQFEPGLQAVPQTHTGAQVKRFDRLESVLR